jgi:hypothetical protein
MDTVVQMCKLVFETIRRDFPCSRGRGTPTFTTLAICSGLSIGLEVGLPVFTATLAFLSCTGRGTLELVAVLLEVVKPM